MSKYFDESCQQSDEFEPVVPPGLCANCYSPTLSFDEELCVDCATMLSKHGICLIDEAEYKKLGPLIDLPF